MRIRGLAIGLVVALAVGSATAVGQGLEVVFFYDPGCLHCKQVEGFLADLQRAGLEFRVQRYDVRTPEGWSLLLKLLTAYGAELGPVPMVFVGDVAMVGDTFYGLGPAPVVRSGLAQELTLEDAIRQALASRAPSPLTRLPPTATEAVVFVPPEGCPDCPLVEGLLVRWAERFPTLGIRRLDPSTPDGASTLEKLKRLYGARGSCPPCLWGTPRWWGERCSSPSAPVVGRFRGDERLGGGDRAGGGGAGDLALDRLRLREQLTLGAVVLGAALDSINPCDFAVLVLLLGTLLVMGKRVKVLWAGFAFAAGIFVAYFAMGFILYSILGVTVGTRSFREPFIYAVSALAILVGLWEMKDLLWYGKWFSIEVPEKWKPSVKKLTASVVSVPGAFVIGLVDSLFLAPCTSGPYIVILTLLSQTTTRGQGALWLLLYNFIFILPMIAITLLVHFGFTTTARAERWRQAKLGTLHFTTGLVMVLIGIGMIVGVRLGYL